MNNEGLSPPLAGFGVKHGYLMMLKCNFTGWKTGKIKVLCHYYFLPIRSTGYRLYF